MFPILIGIQYGRVYKNQKLTIVHYWRLNYYLFGVKYDRILMRGCSYYFLDE